MKIAYIDAQNVHKSIESLGRIIDRKKFLVYLQEKYHIDQTKIFFGYVSHYERMYTYLQGLGYILVFKEALILPDKTIKGNVDVDIAINVLTDMYEYDLSSAYLVTGDGDYNTLVTLLQQKNKLGKVLIPGIEKSSILLRKAAHKNIQDISLLHHKIKKENPGIAT